MGEWVNVHKKDQKKIVIADSQMEHWNVSAGN